MLSLLLIILSTVNVIIGFPDGSDGKNLSTMQETWVGSLGWEDILEKGTGTNCSTLAWKISWTRSLASYSP